MDRVSRLISIGLCLCLSMGLTFARALPRADSTTPTTGGNGDSSNSNAKAVALDSVSTSSGTSTSTSTSSSSSPTSAGAPGSVSVEVWAPLVGIVAVIALMIIYTCFRKNSMNASMIAATRSANDAAATRSQNGASTGRRRPRRTPSQISTRSLPAYMQDPGDQEIVLARGRLRRNRSRPDMPAETDDEYDSGDEDDMEDMEEHDRSLSQSDRPLLASTGNLTTTGTGGESGMGRLAPPGRYDARTSTSFDTMRLGSEDSQHALLRDDPDDMDHHEGGTMYVFGEGTTGGQLYDERDNVEEHVEMRELGGGGVSMGSASSSSSAGSVSGSRPTQNPSSSSNPSSPRRTTAALSPQPKSSFFSSISSILGNSLSSVAHSLSGMNASMSGTVLGGGSYNSIGDHRSQQWGPSVSRGNGSDAVPLRNGVTRADAPSPDGASVRRHNTDATVSSMTTYHTSQTSHSGSALLAPPPSQLPPPYEGDNARSSTETRPRSQSRSSVRPIPFSRSRSRSGSNANQSVVNPSASTLSLNNNTSSSHIRSPSSTSLSISAPLAHTVTKSTFMYPASGPTTEQIKFLSSREALVRFGMPYGHEAVAAAARAKTVTPTNGLSQGDDEAPPPSFEDVAGSSSYNSTPPSGSPRNASEPSNPIPTPTERPTPIATSPISPSDSKMSPISVKSSVSSQYGPKRTDSVASRTSVRSTRSIAGPRGPRNSLRRSTLPSGVGVVGVGAGEDVSSSHIDRERTPRPSMDSVDSIDTVDSFGVEMKRGAQRKDHSALEQMEDMAFWATAADRVAIEGEPTTNEPSTSTAPTTQARRFTLQALPKLVVDNTNSTQSSILPTTIPRGFVMSSPPASPTPTTSTNPHANAFELGVPVITFAPATPSADSHGHGLG